MYQIPFVDKLVMQIEKTRVDDIVDRAHYMGTVIGLIFAMLLIGAKQIFGDPIRCMVPPEYPGSWSNYVNEYCFITTTYVSPNGEPLHESLDSFSPEQRVDISYYQWVPYILLGQALFFYLPHFIWTRVRETADIDFRVVVSKCTVARSEVDTKKQNSTILEVADYIKNAVVARRVPGVTQDGLGYQGSICYCTSKVMALINLLVQLYLLNLTVGQGSAMWGFKIIWNAMNGIYWDRTSFFPRVSYCDWERGNTLGQSHMKMTQCALMVNMLNEKVFTVIYFWFLVLCLMTVANLFYCIVLFVSRQSRVDRVNDYLSRLHAFAPECHMNELRVNQFVEDKLGHDGFLLLYFIEGHAGHLIASAVACQLFKQVYGPDAARVSPATVKPGDDDTKPFDGHKDFELKQMPDDIQEQDLEEVDQSDACQYP